MPSKTTGSPTVEGYIAAFPKEVQAILNKLRQTIRKAAPEAEEKISYQMPGYALHGALVYFAAWKGHIGFYPTASAVTEAFKRELAPFERAKGTIKFPMDRPIPFGLVGKMVEFRVKENMARFKEKTAKTKAGSKPKAESKMKGKTKRRQK